MHELTCMVALEINNKNNVYDSHISQSQNSSFKSIAHWKRTEKAKATNMNTMLRIRIKRYRNLQKILYVAEYARLGYFLDESET
jgi:hypothetical protein